MERSLEDLVHEAVRLGATDAKLLKREDIVFDPRSFLKCRFGCNRWGKYWTCQPNIGITPDQFQAALERYRTAIAIQSTDPRISQEVTLAIEKKAMLEYGALYSFALVLCVMCEKCAFSRSLPLSTSGKTGYGRARVDIMKTLEPLGFKVAFDAQGALLPAWYSMVLLD